MNRRMIRPGLDELGRPRAAGPCGPAGGSVAPRLAGPSASGGVRRAASHSLSLPAGMAPNVAARRPHVGLGASGTVGSLWETTRGTRLFDSLRLMWDSGRRMRLSESGRGRGSSLDVHAELSKSRLVPPHPRLLRQVSARFPELESVITNDEAT
jgi:hypothetical protein